MKIKDFFKSLAEKANIKNADLDTVLAASTLNDIDIPDSFNAEVNNAYLTRDRALNDPNIVAELQKKSNKSAYDTFDQKIKDFLPFVNDKELVDKINAEPQSFQKWDLLKAGLKGTLDTIQETAKGKVNADANKILEEKTKEIKTLTDTYEARLKSEADKLNEVFVNSSIKTKALAYNFADAYKPLKENIADLVVANIKKGYKVALDEKGNVKLFQQVGDSLVEAFEGNEKLTIDKLLEKETKQFVAVSNGTTEKETKETYIPEVGDRSKMTLAEMRAIQTNGVKTLPN